MASRLLGGLPESWRVEKRKWARASRICILRHTAGSYKHHSLHTILLRSAEKETSGLVLWAELEFQCELNDEGRADILW